MFNRFTPRPTSSKAIQHWAQLARDGCLNRFTGDSRMIVADYDVRHIHCPFALFSGHQDKIVDGAKMISICNDVFGEPLLVTKKRSPKNSKMNHTEDHNYVFAETIEHYEHLDFLWGKDAEHLIWSEIIRLLKSLEH
ncbi:hypothetical protein HK098_004018 [Nowakowskiella sp. JEL0407]|nr:hypothetical protein HK098_004018 [Nowakowskiella sp. JEL0407]